MKCRITETTGKGNTIEGNGVVVMRDKEMSAIEGVKLYFDLSGTITSTIVVDKETGWILTAEENRKFSGKAKTSGIEIPMTIEATALVNKKEEKRK